MTGFMTSVAGVALACASLAGFAQTAPDPAATPGVDQRQARQERRIDQGVTSGELAPKEAGKLEAEQARIQQTEQRMKADGRLTSKERQKLHTMQDRSSGHIDRQKHDRPKVNTR